MRSKHSSNWIRISILAVVLALCMSMVVQAQIQIVPIFPRFRFIRVTTYTLTDLGASAGDSMWSFAYGINNSGQVAGEFDFWAFGGIQFQRAFRTMPNQPFFHSSPDDLGVAPGDSRSAAYAINGNGIAVGDSATSFVSWDNGSGTPSHAIRSRPGFPLENLITSSYADRISARGIDSAGRVVGHFKQNGSFNSHAMFSSCGVNCMLPLDTALGFPTQSEAYGINSQTQIVGWRQFSTPKAFMLRPVGSTINGGVIFSPTDIVLPGGVWSKAYAINENSQVVGESGTAAGTQHAFLWKDHNSNGVAESSEIRDLDVYNSAVSGARSVNLSGTAVGYANGDSSIYGGSRATIFIGDGPSLDLNALIPAGTGRWTLRLATGINDNGQIVGYMEDLTNPTPHLRTRHAFRLDPAGYRFIAW